MNHPAIRTGSTNLIFSRTSTRVFLQQQIMIDPPLKYLQLPPRTNAVTLIIWELWKERNMRVFNNKATMPPVLMEKIKDESKNWIFADPKHLTELTG
jgi:hypothetical protein